MKLTALLDRDALTVFTKHEGKDLGEVVRRSSCSVWDEMCKSGLDTVESRSSDEHRLSTACSHKVFKVGGSSSAPKTVSAFRKCASGLRLSRQRNGSLMIMNSTTPLGRLPDLSPRPSLFAQASEIHLIMRAFVVDCSQLSNGAPMSNLHA